MFCLTVVKGKQQGRRTELARYPFVVGNNQEAHLRLSDAGVWVDHLAIELLPGKSPSIRRMGDGLVTVNSEAIDQAALHNGDLIAVGGALLKFSSLPVKRKSLIFHSSASWIALIIVVMIELILMFLLKQ